MEEGEGDGKRGGGDGARKEGSETMGCELDNCRIKMAFGGLFFSHRISHFPLSFYPIVKSSKPRFADSEPDLMPASRPAI